ncbi:MAG: serine/threonine protein kinase [Myxococcus sp.]|nr:serine/threonine protein kinase [Myxococcus sp.]
MGSLLGAGGTARVYLAEDTTTGRQVAVKVLNRELLTDRDMRVRFQKEAALLWQLDHPGIVKLLKFEERELEGLLLVLEWVEGVRLDQLMAREAVRGAVALELLAQLASALGAIHWNSIAHRDVKPENVIVTQWPDRPQVKLLDFGIARFTDPEEAARMAQPDPTRVGGTPSYVSPEQVSGGPIVAASDVYSFGVVAYQLLSGQAPFTGSQSGILRAHATAAPPPLAPLDASLTGHPALEVIMQCLAKRPEDRPPNGAAVEALLRAPPRT